MKINRNLLISILEIASPAIGGEKNQIEECKYLWFTGKALSAFNDVLGVQLELETDFTGGIIGDKLLGILKNSGVEELVLSKDKKENLILECGNAKVTFALKPIEDWFWSPEIPEVEPYIVKSEFKEALRLTLLSVGDGKVQTPEQRGITLISKSGETNFYSTDAITISWTKIPEEIGDIDRVILPTLFCEQAVKNNILGSSLYLTENSVYCQGVILLESFKTDFVLFSRLVEEDEPVDLEGTTNSYITTGTKFPVPDELKSSLDRALVLLSSEDSLECTIEDSHLYLLGRPRSGIGEIDDVMKLKDADKHPNITVNIDPKFLKRGVDHCKTMVITKECVVLTGDKDFYHIIGNK